MTVQNPEWGKVKEVMIEMLANEGIEVDGDEGVPKELYDLGIMDLCTLSEMLRSLLAETASLISHEWMYYETEEESGWRYHSMWKLNNYYVVLYEEPYYLYARAFPDQETAKKELNRLIQRQ